MGRIAAGWADAPASAGLAPGRAEVDVIEHEFRGLPPDVRVAVRLWPSAADTIRCTLCPSCRAMPRADGGAVCITAWEAGAD